MRTMLCIALWAVALPAFSVGPAYLATEVNLDSETPLTAAGMNNNGDVVGTAAGTTEYSAFVYLHHSNSVYLLPHPTPNSGDSGAALNDYGKVGGYSAKLGWPPVATVWYLNGGSEFLISNNLLSYATGVSNNGQVSVTDVNEHGGGGGIWAWRPTLHEIFIGISYASGINGLSHVIGVSPVSHVTGPTQWDFITGDHAFLYANGTLTDLGVIGTAHPESSLGESVAYGLNNDDDVVGQSETSIASHAFLWRRGKLTDLGNLGRAEWSSTARAINDAGEIVGSASADVSGVPTKRAFVYVNGSMYNLTFMVQHRDLNVRLVEAVGINCNGWIAANGYDIRQPNVNRVYLLVPATSPLRLGCPRPR